MLEMDFVFGSAEIQASYDYDPCIQKHSHFAYEIHWNAHILASHLRN